MQTTLANWMLAGRRRSFVVASALIVALPFLLLAERAKALGDPQAVPRKQSVRFQFLLLGFLP